VSPPFVSPPFVSLPLVSLPFVSPPFVSLPTASRNPSNHYGWPGPYPSAPSNGADFRRAVR
jgi:hypothetical protein